LELTVTTFRKIMRIQELVETSRHEPDLMDGFRALIPLAMKELELDQLPNIKLKLHLELDEQPSFGRFVQDEDRIYLAVEDRHPIDILRTFAHELVHYKQGTEHELNPHSGDTGSPQENEAHEIAGIIMRHFDKMHPEFFNTPAVNIGESFKSKAAGLALGALSLGAQATAPQIVQQIVEPGDTIYSIARQSGADPKEIFKLNKMDRNTKLEVGQKVKVPDYAKPIKLPSTVTPTVKQPTSISPAAQAAPMKVLPKVGSEVSLLSANTEAEAALQTAAKTAGLKGAELAQFMAQTRHESADFAHMKEIGNKKKFAKYDRPRIAHRLGNKVKGDGERFKGRGFIQLTGRDNYTRASEQIFGDDRLVKNPDLASKLDVAAKVALWYWKNQVRPNVSNFNNTTEVVKAINKGETSDIIKLRHNKFKEYLAVL
jgi:putative chitinase